MTDHRPKSLHAASSRTNAAQSSPEQTPSMTRPRSDTVLPDVRGYYHCVTRCVRRAWLCGDDPYSGQNFDHRRGWIESRLLELCDHFAAAVYAYAVMSNHVHVVLSVDPALPHRWSDEEVADRWLSLSRELGGGVPDPGNKELECGRRALLSDTARLDEVRCRLGSVSWFMRYLNEAIARAANREDNCTGRFWEGRFHCTFLADDDALLACKAYVDLNPIRSGTADTVAQSRFTSIHRRRERAERHRVKRMRGSAPWRGTSVSSHLQRPSVSMFSSSDGLLANNVHADANRSIHGRRRACARQPVEC